MRTLHHPQHDDFFWHVQDQMALAPEKARMCQSPKQTSDKRQGEPVNAALKACDLEQAPASLAGRYQSAGIATRYDCEATGAASGKLPNHILQESILNGLSGGNPCA